MLGVQVRGRGSVWVRVSGMEIRCRGQVLVRMLDV